MKFIVLTKPRLLKLSGNFFLLLKLIQWVVILLFLRRARRRCLICMEYAARTDPRAPCNHVYCMKCLQDLFKRSMQDETLMPPRCCQKNIPFQLARLTKMETEEFFQKQLEYSSNNRLYCSKTTCSAFIPPSRITDGIGLCPKYSFISNLKFDNALIFIFCMRGLTVILQHVRRVNDPVMVHSLALMIKNMQLY